MKAAATQVLPDAVLTASEQRAVPADNARLVTTLTRHPGGAAVQIHARIDESFTLVYDALVSRAGQASVLPTAVGAGAAIAVDGQTAVAAPVAEPAAEEPEADAVTDSLTARQVGALARWTPDSGETVRDRLAAIVSMAMGYEPEDLPWEVPLIELGLDSMMAVRIKNRVEYDFDMPPIQLQAVRDANLYAVEKLIEYAIEHRDEVQQLHEHQKTQTAEEIAAEQAAMLSGATPAVAAPGADPQADTADPARSPTAADAPIPPPPTNPAGPAAQPAQPNLAGPRRRSTSRPLPRRSSSDVPPRDAAERVTFATWAIVTGKSPGGIFNDLPKLDDAAAAKMARAVVRARRGHDHRRRRQGGRDHRGSWRPPCANSWRPARSTASSARFGPGPKAPPSQRFSCSTPRAARRWSTSRC